MFKALQNSLLSIIYPQQCRICSRQVTGLDGGVACALCWDETKFFKTDDTLCSKCGAYMRGPVPSATASCRRCIDHFYDRASALGAYETALAASIVDLKTVPRLPARLHDAIHTHFLAVDAFAGDVIIPIPLSRQRQHERGFNQAEVIADAVGRIAGLTVDRSSLVRKLNTPAHRIAMDQRARELSVDGAFEVLRPKLVKGRRVLLVDDVLTSGSTASSCAKVLKKNGAGEVNVFTLARAVMH